MGGPPILSFTGRVLYPHIFSCRGAVIDRAVKVYYPPTLYFRGDVLDRACKGVYPHIISFMGKGGVYRLSFTGRGQTCITRTPDSRQHPSFSVYPSDTYAPRGAPTS